MARLVSLFVPLFLTVALPAAAATILPEFDSGNFRKGASIDNPYLPWRVGAKSAQVAHYVSDGERVTERDAQTVLGRGPKILGVRTTTVLDKGYENGVLTEKTFDHYAQDRSGNVWYMGEDTTSFEYDDKGKLVSKSSEGSWRAGRHNALPGYAMPVDLTPGFAYYQEFAPADDAVDEARTVGVLDSLKVGSTTYRNVLQVLETTAAEPDSREFKFYAPGVGLIRAEEDLDVKSRQPRCHVQSGRGRTGAGATDATAAPRRAGRARGTWWQRLAIATRPPIDALAVMTLWHLRPPPERQGSCRSGAPYQDASVPQ